jgi:hypothetical protein
VEVPLEEGLPAGENVVDVRLTHEGAEEQEGEGGKMITSLEIMEYGGEGRYVHAPNTYLVEDTADEPGSTILSVSLARSQPTRWMAESPFAR